MDRLTSSVARRRQETMMLDHEDQRRSQLYLYTSLAVVFGLIFIPVFYYQMKEWPSFKPQFQIERKDWRVLEDNQASCSDIADASCLAHPSNPALWESTINRGDAQHKRRTRSWTGKSFWLGTTISAEKLREAIESDAQYLILGRFSAAYRIWIDGIYYTHGAGRGEGMPQMISLPYDRFRSGEPLRVAIKLDHRYQHITPDPMNTIAGGEGFSNSEGASVYTSLMSFWSISRPASFFLAYFFLSILFFYLWRSSPTDQEYFYLALNLLIVSFMQARLIDALDIQLNLHRHFRMGFVLEFYKGGIGLLLGLSFARTKVRMMRAMGVLIFIAPWMLYPFLKDGFTAYAFFNHTRNWVSPCLSIVGGFVCFLQAYYLQAQGKTGAYLPIRIKRLMVFGSMLFLMSMMYIVHAHFENLSLYLHQYLCMWLGVEHFFLIFYMGHIAATEIKHQNSLIYMTPLSDYHKMVQLPERVEGVLLVLDLKSSEFFYRSRAESGSSVNLVTLWRTHVYNVIAPTGGVIVQKKGDEVSVLFDRKKRPSSVVDALMCIEAINKSSILFERQLAEQSLMPKDAPGFRFRLAIVPTKLKPIWENVGESKIPAWESYQGDESFEQIEAMFKTEKGLPGGVGATRAIIPASIFDQYLSHEPLEIISRTEQYVVYIPKGPDTADEVVA